MGIATLTTTLSFFRIQHQAYNIKPSIYARASPPLMSLCMTVIWLMVKAIPLSLFEMLVSGKRARFDISTQKEF